MTENKRFTLREPRIDNDIHCSEIADNGQWITYGEIVDMLNELSLWRSRYNEVKEARFTKMGGFSMERDGRGRYHILSENIIPKDSPVIAIKSPDTLWNAIVAEIFINLLTEEGG